MSETKKTNETKAISVKKCFFDVKDFAGIKTDCFKAMASFETEFFKVAKNGGEYEILLKSDGKKEFDFEKIQVALGLFNANYLTDKGDIALVAYPQEFDVKKYDSNGKLSGSEKALKFIVCRETDAPKNIDFEVATYDDLPKKLQRDKVNRGKKGDKPSDASDADNGKKTDAVVEDIVLRQLKKFTPKVIAVGVTSEQLKKIEDAFKAVFTDYLNEV